MSEISVVPFAQAVQRENRWDAEAYTPVLLQLQNQLAKAPKLITLTTITHPSEIPRIYGNTKDSKPFILAQNIKPIMLDISSVEHIPLETYQSIPINKLETGDVLITRSGAYSGVAGVYLGKSGEAYTSGEGIIVRSRGEIDGAYLAVYLSSTFGAAFCRRAIYGSGQPHIMPRYLEPVPVPRLGDLETTVESLVKRAYHLIETTSPYYPEAETELLERIGWAKLIKHNPELNYVEDFAVTKQQGRIDAEYFQPQYKRLRKHLQNVGAQYIGDFCPMPHRGVQPEFVESGKVSVIDSKAVRVSGVEPSEIESTSEAFYNLDKNTKARVTKGNVLLNSTGRGTLGRAACYQHTALALADNHVAIIKPDNKICLSLYLALFLNSPAGLAQSEMFQTGSSGQLEIYSQQIAQFLIYLPKNSNGQIDIKWQEKLVAKVEAARDAKVEATAKLAQAKKLVEDAIFAQIWA